jgi:hypothetical protein
MKDKVEIELAWEIWHLISRLNDLIWDYYEDEFMKKNRQNTRLLYRENLKDYLKDDDFVF